MDNKHLPQCPKCGKTMRMASSKWPAQVIDKNTGYIYDDRNYKHVVYKCVCGYSKLEKEFCIDLGGNTYGYIPS